MKDSAVPNEYKTSDLYLAAYLQTAGVEMKRTDRESTSSKVFFVFDTTLANLAELQQAWYSNTGKVAAQPYAFAVKSLKSLVHQQ